MQCTVEHIALCFNGCVERELNVDPSNAWSFQVHAQALIHGTGNMWTTFGEFLTSVRNVKVACCAVERYR